MKKIIKKNGLRIISAALLLFASAFIAMPSFASEAGNVKLDIYTFSPDYLYPERNAETMTFCATTYADSIDGDWGGGDILGCGSDFVAIHYTGTMTFTSDSPVYLMAIADDGFSLTLDGASVIEDWTLKGCSGSVNTFTPAANHSYVLDAWFYEYGGGACSTLYSAPVDGSTPWSVVQSSAFLPLPVVEPEPSPEPLQPSPEPSEETIHPSPEPLPSPSVTEPEPTPAPQITPEPQPTEQEQPLPPVEEIPSIEPPIIVEEPIITQEEIVEQLAEEAEADDPVVPEELAAIPLIGNAAVAVLEAFNALGNIGADMAPEVREKSEKVVVGAIIAGQIAQVAAASSVAASASTRKNN